MSLILLMNSDRYYVVLDDIDNVVTILSRHAFEKFGLSNTVLLSGMFVDGISGLKCAYSNCKFLKGKKCTSTTVKNHLLERIYIAIQIESGVQVSYKSHCKLYEMSLYVFVKLLKKFDTTEKCPQSLGELASKKEVKFSHQDEYEKWERLIKFFSDTLDFRKDFYYMIYDTSILYEEKIKTLEQWGRCAYKGVTGLSLSTSADVLKALLGVKNRIYEGLKLGYYSEEDIENTKKSELYKIHENNFTNAHVRNLKNIDNFVQSINVSSCSLTKKSIDGIVTVNTCSVSSDSLYIATAKGYMNDIRKLALKSFVDKMKQRKNYVEGLEKFICIKRATILKTRSIIIAIGLKDGIESLEKVMVNEYLESKGLEDV